MDNSEWASPLVITALAGAGAVLITAFFAGVVSLITAWRTVASKVVAIEAHVNSDKTKMEGEKATLRKENDLLREMLVERKATAALLAQAAATAPTIAAALATPPPVQAAHVGIAPVTVTGLPIDSSVSLAHIEKNTADTAKNTARTDANVQDLKEKA